MLVQNPHGNYRFIRGSAAIAGGVVADKGFGIVRAMFRTPPPLGEGYARVEQHLREAGRPIQALCAMELRIPEPLSNEAFNAFNQPYVQKLEEWGLAQDGATPVARTNVAPAINRVEKPSLFGFCYTIPSAAAAAAFVVSGAPEIRALDGGGVEVVSAGDTSTEGMRRKVAFVLEVLSDKLKELSAGWREASAVEVYTIHPIGPLMDTILPAVRDSGQLPLRWHFSRPPVRNLDVELDVRGVLREIIL